MIDFFQSTLEKNFGRRDAVDLFIKGLRQYNFCYILDVDKARLKEINKKLYGDGWFDSYFFDYDEEMSTNTKMKVELIPVFLNLYPENGVCYYRKEMKKSSHLAIKETVNFIENVGAISSEMVLSAIESGPYDFIPGFKSDRDVQLFVTLVFWKYLCHSANVNFFTGMDRKEELLKEFGR